MSKTVKWLELNEDNRRLFLCKFVNSDDVFTCVQAPELSMEESLSLRSLGFVRLGKFYLRSGSTFSLKEMKSVFPSCKISNVEESSIKVIFSDKLPAILSQSVSILDNEVEKPQYQKGDIVLGKFVRLNDFQVSYSPSSQVGKPIAAIPINLASGTLEALNRINTRYGDLDKWVCAELGYSTVDEMAKYLSPEQVDAVALAIDNAYDGMGSICADQTGLGKGRVGAALARWAAKNNRLFIFITEKANLFTDFWRDIVDTKSDEVLGTPYIMNNGAKIIDPVTSEDVFKSLPLKENKKVIEDKQLPENTKIVMLTYSQLSRKGSAKNEFLSEISNGAHIHEDECHNAAGATSNTSNTVAEAMKNATSYSFSSATHARDASNMAIYSPLLPPSISKLENMSEVLASGGSPLLEALSQMLAQTGRLVRREHDLSDMSIKLLIDKKRRHIHEEYSDRLAPILSGLSRMSMDVDSLMEEKSTMGKGEKWYAVHWGTRISAVVNQFLASCKIDLQVEQAVECLKNGEKPVIVLVNTMETLLKEILDEEIDDDNIEENLLSAFGDKPSFKDVLKILVDRSLYVRMKKGKSDPELHKIEDDNILKQANDLLNLIEGFPELPISPIDEIQKRIEDEGIKLYNSGQIQSPWKMGEISARKLRINGVQIESIKDVDRNRIINDFQHGQLDGLVLTKAASTGLSLHANEKSKDKRPRVMFEFQIPPNVVERIQFWGRIKRRGGINEPRFVCLATDLSFELRGLANQNRKVSELSANVTGSSQAAVSMNIPDPINSLGNKIAKRIFIENRKVAYKMGVSLNVDQEKADEELYFVNKILSRLALLNSAEREAIYNSFLQSYLESLKDLEKRGAHPSKPRVLDGTWTVVDREIFEPENPDDGEIFGAPVYLTTIKRDLVLNPLSEEDIKKIVISKRSEFEKRFEDQRFGKAHAHVIDYLKNNRGDILRSVLAKKYSSVIDALNSSDNNMVKIEAGRIKSVIDFIDSVNFGSKITVTEEDERVEGVILDVEIPTSENEYTKLGQYFISYVIPGDEEPRKVSLASLMNDENYTLEKFNKKEFEKPSYPEFRNLPSGKTSIQRKILDGNPFMAVKTAVDKGLGKSTRISMDDGNTVTAVLIPKSKQKYINHFPGTTNDVYLAIEILKQGGEIYTNSMAKKEGMILYRDGPNIKIYIPGKKSLNKVFLSDEITSIAGEFSGDWRGMYAHITPEVFVEELGETLKEKGLSFNFSSEWRELASSFSRNPEKISNTIGM